MRHLLLVHRYLAFVSGCDDGAPVSGISHQIFDVSHADTSSFLSKAASVARQGLQFIGARRVPTLFVVLLQFFGNMIARLAMRLPLIGAIGGAFVGFRKIVRPW